ncbi:MAG: MarR family winged helix-turn-helix transcriptional regulator [Parvularculaceae bacterium]|nr:MarR family winged helix-turn-helix transcriptional regulator [Parvularculaceae bacterium]
MAESHADHLFRLLPLVVHRLTAAGDAIHAARGLTTGMRSLLIGLASHGPRTVSHMADDRPVSRQYIQRLVDALSSMGLVVATTNPHHKRSPLIALTRAGQAMVRTMQAAEAPHSAALLNGLAARDLDAAVRVLTIMSERLSPEALEETFVDAGGAKT